MEAPGQLTIDSDGVLFWAGLYDWLAMKSAGRDAPIAADYINDATITWVIRAAGTGGAYDAAGALATNGGGTMSYVTASNGNYIGTIEDGATLTVGSTYWVIATASASGDRVGIKRLQVVVTP